jgi:hypothetical protein
VQTMRELLERKVEVGFEGGGLIGEVESLMKLIKKLFRRRRNGMGSGTEAGMRGRGGGCLEKTTRSWMKRGLKIKKNL